MTNQNQSKWTRKYENLKCTCCNASTDAHLYIGNYDADKQELLSSQDSSFTSRIYCSDCIRGSSKK